MLVKVSIRITQASSTGQVDETNIIAISPHRNIKNETQGPGIVAYTCNSKAQMLRQEDHGFDRRVGCLFLSP